MIAHRVQRHTGVNEQSCSCAHVSLAGLQRQCKRSLQKCIPLEFGLSTCECFEWLLSDLQNSGLQTGNPFLSSIILVSQRFVYFYFLHSFSASLQRRNAPSILTYCPKLLSLRSHLFYSHAIRENAVTLYLVPVWRASVNYLCAPVRVKQTDRGARHQLLPLLLGKRKALESNECIVFTCCYIIHALLTHLSPLCVHLTKKPSQSTL